LGIKTPSGSLRGNDQRAIYLDTDKGSNAYVMTNSNKGYVYNTSKVQKNFDNGLFASVAYNYLISKKFY
jgi:hypothetical protein